MECSYKTPFPSSLDEVPVVILLTTSGTPGAKIQGRRSIHYVNSITTLQSGEMLHDFCWIHNEKCYIHHLGERKGGRAASRRRRRWPAYYVRIFLAATRSEAENKVENKKRRQRTRKKMKREKK